MQGCLILVCTLVCWRSMAFSASIGYIMLSYFKLIYYYFGKGKVNHAPQESVDGCSFPSPRPWPRRWRTTNVCDAWPVRRQTYGYLPSRKASPPIGWFQIILLGIKRHMCVNNLPSVALHSGEARIRTHDLSIASPAPAEPLGQRTLHVGQGKSQFIIKQT